MYFYIGENKLEFHPENGTVSFQDQKWFPDIRTFGQMRDLYPPVEKTDESPMYFMYRGLYFSETDKQQFEKNHLRYDVTILVPEMIGNQPNKTFGHFHPKNSSGEYFQEIYQVISGQAIYLLQNENKVFFTQAQSKQSVNMDASFGHITINPSATDYLVMCNIVSSEFSSLYGVYEQNKGANFYYTSRGWEKNPTYQNNLEIEESFKKNQGVDIYFDYLAHQEKYLYLQ